MNAKLKKIGNIVLDIFVVLILIVSLTVVVFSATGRKTGYSNIFGYTFLSVETDSMEPTIKVGDLIIGRVSASGAEYEVGDVVTFREIRNQTVIFNTHRIVEKFLIDGSYQYATKGDNAEGTDDLHIMSDKIIAEWTGVRIPLLGGVIDFLRSGIGFFLCLMLPVILFFLFYLYKFIRNLVAYNRENAIEAAKEASAQVEEEQKQKIIAEYLAAQAEAQAKADEGESAGEQREYESQE